MAEAKKAVLRSHEVKFKEYPNGNSYKVEHPDGKVEFLTHDQFHATYSVVPEKPVAKAALAAPLLPPKDEGKKPETPPANPGNPPVK